MRYLGALVLALTLALTSSAHANLIKFEATGTLSDVDAPMQPFVSVGDPWVFTFTVDENEPSYTDGENTFYDGVITFDMGPISIVSTGEPTSHVAIRPSLDVISFDLIFPDAFSGTWPATITPRNIFLSFRQHPALGAVPDGSLDNLININPAQFNLHQMAASFFT